MCPRAGLIPLILVSESMNNKERQWWIDNVPYMNDKQAEKLYNILMTERIKLQAIEEEFYS